MPAWVVVVGILAVAVGLVLPLTLLICIRARCIDVSGGKDAMMETEGTVAATGVMNNVNVSDAG
jgi:hypothetical protein